MRLEQFRREMESYRRIVDEEARALKDSYAALNKLHVLYQGLSTQERAMADHVLAEWVLSDDEGVRFDALTLIDDFKIGRSLPALRQLASRLSSSDAPGAPFELRKVNRIIVDLRGPAVVED